MGAAASTQRWTAEDVQQAIGVLFDDEPTRAAWDEAKRNGTVDADTITTHAVDPKEVLFRNLQRFKEEQGALGRYGTTLRDIAEQALEGKRRQRDGGGEVAGLDDLYAVAEKAIGVFGELVTQALSVSDVAEAPAPAPAPGPAPEAPARPYFLPSLKPRARCAAKAATRYGGKVSRVFDVVRGSLIVETESQVLDVYEKLSKLNIVRLKNRFAKPLYTGYRDLLLTIAVPVDEGDHLCELCIQLDAVEAASSYALYCFMRPFFLNATTSQARQRRDLLLALPAASDADDFVDKLAAMPKDGPIVCVEFFRAVFLGAPRAVRERSLLFSELPLYDATSLEDLATRILRSNDVHQLEAVVDLLENVPFDQRTMRRKLVLLKEEARGRDHRTVATALVKLASCETEYARKARALQRALPLYERDFGKDSVKVAAVLGNLGGARGALGDSHAMRACLERALAIKERTYGVDHPTVGVTLNNLGKALTDLGEIKRAREYLERALVINEHVYGYDDGRIAVILTNVGNARGDLGLFAEAAEAFERALEIYEAHGAALAGPLADLGHARGALCDWRGKRDLFARALVLYEAQFGRRHERVARMLAGLGESYGHLGDDRMKTVLEEALSIFEERDLGEEVASTLLLLAKAHDHLGDYARQKELVERAMELQGAPTARALVSLANAHGALGDAKQKCTVLERALAIEEREYGAGSLRLTATLYSLAIASAADKRGSRKVELMERILAAKEREYGEDDRKVRSALYAVGAAHAAYGDAARQIVVVERALAFDETEFGAESVKVAVALVSLARAYTKKNDEDKAETLLRRALVIFDREGIDGEDIVNRGPPPAVTPYERPEDSSSEAEEDDRSYGSDAGILPAKAAATELYQALQELEFKRQKIMKAQEAARAEEPQVDAGMTLDLGKVAWHRLEIKKLAVLRAELGDDWAQIAEQLGTGRTAAHCARHVSDMELRAAVEELGAKQWDLVGERVGVKPWLAEKRWIEINTG